MHQPNSAVFEGFLHGVMLANKAIRRGSGFLCFLYERLFLSLKVLAHLAALLRESILSPAFRFVRRHVQEKESPQVNTEGVAAGCFPTRMCKVVTVRRRAKL